MEEKVLILTRRIGESLRVGDDVTLTVLGVDMDSTVKFGFNAPKDVDIHRQEVYDRIQKQKKALSHA